MYIYLFIYLYIQIFYFNIYKRKDNLSSILQMENHKKKFNSSLKQINNRVHIYWDEPAENGMYISYLVKKNNWCIFHKQAQVGSIGLKNKRLV